MSQVQELQHRVDELLEANNRYLEEARVAKRMSAVTSTALAAAQVQLLVLREALEVYADPQNYDSNGAVGAHLDPNIGTTARQALLTVFGEPKPS